MLARLAPLPRIALIDGLRGFAALAVVLYHFKERLDIRGLAGVLARNGNLGVALFFVLSGFVITLSLGDRLISPGYLGRFALRRSLRLDPPYWCAIAVMVVLALLGGRYGVHAAVPTIPAVLAHLVYLQDLLGEPAILPTFWSLVFEVQFYLAVALLLFALQRGETPSRRVGQPVFQAVFLAGIVASLACRHFGIGRAVFISQWFCFAVGASTYWAVVGWVDRRYTYAAIGLVLGFGILRGDAWAIAAALSATLILTAASVNRLDWLSGPVPQFLGRISYSVYLTHPIFGWYCLQIALRYVSRPAAFVISMAVCLGSSWLWYRLIERPSVRLSHRVTMGAQR